MMIKKFFVAILLLVAAVIGFWIVVDNPEPVTFRLLGFVVSVLPLGLWALLVFLCGCFTGILASFLATFKKRSRTR
jgi:uncharacterized integral membrane protein